MYILFGKYSLEMFHGRSMRIRGSLLYHLLETVEPTSSTRSNSARDTETSRRVTY